MRRSPRNLRIACDHRGLTHFGGVYFFHEFLQLLQLRDFLARHLSYPRRNHRYSLSQMILALLYPLVLGLDRLETASFLRSNGTFQYLTGLPNFPDPQTLPAAHNAACLTGESPVGVITREPRSISPASGVILASKRDVKVSERRLQAYRS